MAVEAEVEACAALLQQRYRRLRLAGDGRPRREGEVFPPGHLDHPAAVQRNLDFHKACACAVVLAVIAYGETGPAYPCGCKARRYGRLAPFRQIGLDPRETPLHLDLEVFGILAQFYIGGRPYHDPADVGKRYDRDRGLVRSYPVLLKDLLPNPQRVPEILLEPLELAIPYGNNEAFRLLFSLRRHSDDRVRKEKEHRHHQSQTPSGRACAQVLALLLHNVTSISWTRTGSLRSPRAL